jgi:hypothetical protein
VFAHAGTTPSTLLLPEQAASRVPKINNATTGPMGLLPDQKRNVTYWDKLGRSRGALVF